MVTTNEERGARKPAGRSVKRKRRGKRIGGLKARYACLLRSGAIEEARAWHARHRLAEHGIPAPALHPKDEYHTSPHPSDGYVPSSHPLDGYTPASPITGSAGPSPSSGFASHGGEGSDLADGRGNWDKTTPTVENSQCSPLATATDVPLAVEADLTRLAAKADCTPTVTPPAGESEGERGFGQAESRSAADNAGVTDKIVSVWPKVGEAIVGKLCRNKQYNELRVVGEDGREMWTKVGNWLFTSGLIRGERVLVRKIWGSGDDTDAEYEVVRRLDVNEPAEERRAESGSDSGSEFVAPVVAHESAVSEQQTPEASLDAQQTPVAILPQFQREEPDYPRKPESGEDYIARIRAEAAMWANGQGR
jgi:hypothetical protein